MIRETVHDDDLREEIGKEFDDFSYAVLGEYSAEDKPERIVAILNLILAARIKEREYTWKLVNDIRYKNISPERARDEALDRLSTLQAEQDMADTAKQNLLKDDR